MNAPYNMYNNANTPSMPLSNPGEGRSVNSSDVFPVIPLPNPGEGGPVDSGNDGFPVIPLPNPGEGGPVDSGNDGFPVIPLPNPGEGGPVDPGDGFPVIPLPNPGEGGPVDPGFSVPPFPNPGGGGPITSIITVYPKPIIPCFFCGFGASGNVRFLNAATGYNPFLIYVNGQLVVNALDYAQVSNYGRVASGSQTITVTGLNGYVYIQKQIMVNSGSTMTVAIVNTVTGLDLTEIPDFSCNTPQNTACFRVCNLSYNSGPLDVTLNNGYAKFTDVRYTEVTPFINIRPGGYRFTVSRSAMGFGTSGVLVSSFINVQPNTLYTMYIFNWNTSQDAIRTMVVEDRK